MASPSSFYPLRPDFETLPPRVSDWLATYGQNMAAEARNLIAATMMASPFLATLIERWPDDIEKLANGDFEAQGQKIDSLIAQAADAQDLASASAALREARTRFALGCALMDIGGHWSILDAARKLSQFADHAVQTAANFLLRRAHEKGDLELPNPKQPERGSGLVILAMGKFGAMELNYSSDIDLIILFDLETTPYCGRKDPHQFFVRFAKELVQLLQERTGDGYVFRIDLRLRPDASMTPPALPLSAATAYYESTGETWERSAMIKARPVAGDIDLGKTFLSEIRPFIWRTNLDFAALDDVMKVTAQIRTARREPANPPAGVNVKLGRGGIREVEFFVQAQQLIRGGRNHALRTPRTLDGLDALTEQGFVEPETAIALTKAYQFLRQVEHRLQMVQDEQTQTLPLQDAQLSQLSAFLGFPNVAAFQDALDTHRHAVKTAFDSLFDNAGLSQANGSDNQSVAYDQLAEELGYENPAAVQEMVERWQSGSYRAFRSERARTLAKDMTATILERFAGANAGDIALARFDGFLSHLPAGVQLFTLLRAHDWLLDELLAVLSIAPELAQMLERKPALLDILLDGEGDDRIHNIEQAEADLSFLLASARSYEETLDFARRWFNDHKFLIGVRQIAGRVDAAQAGTAMANCLEAAIRCLKPIVENEFANQHGTLPDGCLGIVALGKLGTRDLTATSDADLILVYDFDQAAKQSNGQRPLSPSQYFQRLGQRVIASLSALTAEGRIVEVDMRMRPQGNSGPLCTRADSFRDYYAEGGAAWTYEAQALLKARVIAAPPPLMVKLDEVITANRSGPRDNQRVRSDIATMRARMDSHFKATSPWNLKQVRGGMVDIEFLLQALILEHGAEGQQMGNGGALINYCKMQDWLSNEDAELLGGAYALYTSIQSLKRLCITGTFDPANLPAAFTALLLRTTGASSLEDLQAQLTDYQSRIKTLFERELPLNQFEDAAAPKLAFD